MTVSRKTHRISLNDDEIECNDGDNLLATLNANKVSISQSCGGNATCTTCLVSVVSGIENLSAREGIEAEHAWERGFNLNERLACQTDVFGDIQIEIQNPDEN